MGQSPQVSCPSLLSSDISRRIRIEHSNKMLYSCVYRLSGRDSVAVELPGDLRRDSLGRVAASVGRARGQDGQHHGQDRAGSTHSPSAHCRLHTARWRRRACRHSAPRSHHARECLRVVPFPLRPLGQTVRTPARPGVCCRSPCAAADSPPVLRACPSRR